MYNYYIIINIISLLLVIFLLYISFKKRDEKVGRAFLFSMIFMVIWVVSTTLELMTSDYALSLFFRNLVQVGMAFVAMMNYRFVLYYTELYEIKFYNYLYKILLWINIIMMGLLFTDPLHHFLRSSITFENIDGDMILSIVSTPLGCFAVMIRFLIFALSTILLFNFLFKSSPNSRKQVSIIGLGFLLALVLTLLKQYWLGKIGYTIPMSSILIVPFIFIAIGIFRFDFLYVTPVAIEWVINSLSEGIIVFSNLGKILETNSAANKFIDYYADKITKEWILELLKGYKDSITELSFYTPEMVKYYQIHLHHLLADNGRKKGSVVLIRDITVEKHQEHELVKKADYDSLTQVYNKMAIQREYNLMKEEFISLLIIDVDKFKLINDNYGHPTGDVVLVSLARIFEKCTSKSDRVGRIGGDEFCVLLNKCDEDKCKKIIGSIYNAVEEEIFDTEVNFLSVEISIGAIVNIDTLKISFDVAYRQVDKALYEAKKNGRHQYVIKKIS